MNPLFSATIPGRPFCKKSTQRVIGVGRSKRAIYSPKYLSWANQAMVICLRSFKGPLITELVTLKLHFWFKDHQAEPDTSNLTEGIQDVLQKAGVIKNDKQIYELIASKHFGGEPRTEVEIYEYKEVA